VAQALDFIIVVIAIAISQPALKVITLNYASKPKMSHHSNFINKFLI
jgi:hypothetical protein